MSWEFFDGIFCINLLSRDDRYQAASELFKTHNIPVQFHRVTKHPNGGLQGCFESHVQVIKNAYDTGMNNVLIFEDDLVTTSNYNKELLADAIKFMSEDDTWDIFYLGPFPEIKRFTTKSTSYQNVYKIHSLCGHAYVVSRRFMEKFKDAQFTGIPLDYIYEFNEHSYAIYPGLFAQGASVSDNGGNVSLSLDTLPKVKQCFFRVVELYGYHVNVRLIWWAIALFVLWYIIIIVYPQRKLLHLVIFAFAIVILFVAAK